MKISIFGVGYVGAVSSGCLVSLGHEVTAMDVSADKVGLINRGISPIVEAEIDTLIADGVGRGRLRATGDVAEAVAGSDVSFISVGTPSAANGSVSMVAVNHVVRDIGTALRHKRTPHVIVMVSARPRCRQAWSGGICEALDVTMGFLIQAPYGPASRPVVVLA